MEAVNQYHQSAGHTAPTRDVDAEQGVGTARREEANMLPRSNTRIKLAGRTVRSWGQTAARENKGGVLPKSRPTNVFTKLANNDPSAMGIKRGFVWGIAGVGAEDSLEVAPANGSKNMLFLGLAALAGLYFIRR